MDAEPNQNNKDEDVLGIVRAAELISITLVTSRTKASAHPSQIKGQKVAINLGNQSQWEATADEKALLCYVAINLYGFPREPWEGKDSSNIPEEQRLFEIEASFCLTYTLSDPNLKKTAFDAFCQSTATFNAHPYLREFIDQSMRRMGLDGFYLPLLKIGR